MTGEVDVATLEAEARRTRVAGVPAHAGPAPPRAALLGRLRRARRLPGAAATPAPPSTSWSGRDGRPRPGWDALGAGRLGRRGAARRARAGRPAARGRRGHLQPAPGVAAVRGRGSPARVLRPAGSRWRLDPLPTVVAAEDWADGRARRRPACPAARGRCSPTSTARGGCSPPAWCRPSSMWRHGPTCARPGAPHPADRPRIVVSATDLGRDADGALGGRGRPDPGALGPGLRDGEPPGRGPAAPRGLPPGRPAPADRLLHAAPRRAGRPGRRPALEDPRVVVLTPGRSARPPSTRPTSPRCSASRSSPAPTSSCARGGCGPATLGDRRARRRHAAPRRRRLVRPPRAAPRLRARRARACWRRPAAGRSSIANALGSGLVESPALAAFLPALCEALLDEPLLLPSAPTWWCGDPIGLAHVLAHLDRLVLRPVDPARGRGVHGPGLTAAQRDRWRAA